MTKRIDKHNMRKMIRDFPKQFLAGLEAAKNVKVIGDYNQIIFCGLGGSALAGAILKMLSIFYQWPINIKVYRSYNLPSRLSPGALVFIISYSGNTEEVISSYQKARERKLIVVGISTNGKLAKLCKKDKTPWVQIPTKPKIPPRLSVGYQFGAIIRVLSNSNIINELDSDIKEIQTKLKTNKLEKQGKTLARKLKDKIPIIYASDKYRNLAYIWKISFNENSKLLAFYNYFPELNHNEIEGLEKIQNLFQILILRDKKLDHPRILKRMMITKKLFQEKGFKVNIIDIAGKDLLSKIFSNYLLGQWASYYLALEYQTDPWPVKTIEEFKKMLE